MIWESFLKKYKRELSLIKSHTKSTNIQKNIILGAKEIIKSPGIPEKAPMIKKIKANNIPLMSEIEFAYRYKGESKIVCITGSNGKTTTTTLTYEIFKHAGYDVSVVGNIGYSFARQIAIQPTAWYIMEISSFQLDDLFTFRPDIAVITNITPDHLDRYEYDFNLYVKAKFNIAKFQTANDFLIICKDDKASIQYLETNKQNPKILFFTMNEQLNTDGAYMNQNELILRTNGEPF